MVMAALAVGAAALVILAVVPALVVAAVVLVILAVPAVLAIAMATVDLVPEVKEALAEALTEQAAPDKGEVTASRPDPKPRY